MIYWFSEFLRILSMNEKFVRHFISFLGMLVTFLAYWVGYASAGSGWWWTGFSVIIIYIIIYVLLEV